MLALLATVLLGCEAECQSDTRMNGDYAVQSYATSPTTDIQGENVDAYPFPFMFWNDWSVWNLEYIASQSIIQLEIDEQPFTAEFYRAPEECTDFTMSFAGTYLSSVGSTHSFEWSADMSYQGPHIGGVWTYQDTWTWPDEGLSGSITVPEGLISLDAGGEVEDSG